ncbi:NAD(P)/FAD-dependent oxidoreductase [Chitinispirillales bacterium ANBcel5]|uniref:phytoene desaturase family protein n=1 Tax=Cellulosispirillum alkaliphilum TaxID=3039283 RepID=UPI002A59374E|nr:NAD(P)/FAD-dependent oxidoreductase [Chitinispirillales bacterium ANBcel5]
MQKYDAIVIGAGIGGLFCAAKLAKEGKKVVVLEQHSVPGGYAATFKRKQFVFEASVHAIDGLFDPQSHNSKLFDEFKIRKHVQPIRLPEFFKVVRNDLQFTLPDDLDQAIKLLKEKYPQDKKSLDKYSKTLRKIRKQILYFQSKGKPRFHMIPSLLIHCYGLFLYLFKSFGSFMDKLTTNDDLKLILGANIAYYHDDPYVYSSLHHIGAQGSFLSGGGAYIQGGSQQIARYLVDYIQNRGGEVLLKSKVSKVLGEKKSVNGVEYSNKKGEINQIFADNVVCNANLPSLMNELLSEETSGSLRKKYSSHEPSHSIFSLYMGLKKPLTELGNDSYSTFLFPDSVTNLKELAKSNSTTDYEQKTLVMVDYSIIDAKLSKDNAPVAACVLVDDIKHWENLSKEEYKRKKEEVSQTILKRIEAYMPGIGELIEYKEAATPLTMKRYTLNERGAVYGYAPNVNQIGPRRPENYTGIKGLYLASAWSKQGGGISPAAKSGYAVAEAILKKP